MSFPESPEGHTLTGDFRHHPGFHSEFLEADRDILVYLPPGYETGDPDRRYPVLYLHDGQNVFDNATAFGGQEWRADETAEELIQTGLVEPIIMVAIYNTGVHRIDEYTPVPNPRGAGGQGALYGRMLVEELKPFIDSEYKTKPAPTDTGLVGSSLGGLITLYLGLHYPDVFGKLGILSPAVWWANRTILAEIEALPAKPELRIWLDMGTCEGETPERCIEDARAVRDALLDQGWQLDEDLFYIEADGADHSEGAWAGRMAPLLTCLFPAVTLESETCSSSERLPLYE